MQVEEMPSVAGGGRKTPSQRQRAWLMSSLAAPALPTVTLMGSSRASRAKYSTFFGIVAEKSIV